MSWDVSFTIHCECDRCGHSEDYDMDEPMDECEVERFLEREDWMERDGETLCMECYNDTKGIDEFTDKCRSCWHYLVYWHCPQFKMSCEDVYSMLADTDFNEPGCPKYMPIGGKKDNTPKYKPTDASLTNFGVME